MLIFCSKFTADEFFRKPFVRCLSVVIADEISAIIISDLKSKALAKLCSIHCNIVRQFGSRCWKMFLQHFLFDQEFAFDQALRSTILLDATMLQCFAALPTKLCQNRVTSALLIFKPS